MSARRFIKKSDLFAITNESNHLNWLKTCENTFEFSRNLKGKFDNGSLGQRQQILKTLGASYVLKDKQLEIKFNSIFEPFLRLGPANSMETTTKTEPTGSILSKWLRRLERVSRAFYSGEAGYFPWHVVSGDVEAEMVKGEV